MRQIINLIYDTRIIDARRIKIKPTKKPHIPITIDITELIRAQVRIDRSRIHTSPPSKKKDSSHEIDRRAVLRQDPN